MNVYNLAAIFGPNILHRYKNSQAASDSHFLVGYNWTEKSCFCIRLHETLCHNSFAKHCNFSKLFLSFDYRQSII